MVSDQTNLHADINSRPGAGVGVSRICRSIPATSPPDVWQHQAEVVEGAPDFLSTRPAASEIPARNLTGASCRQHPVWE